MDSLVLHRSPSVRRKVTYWVTRSLMFIAGPPESKSADGPQPGQIDLGIDAGRLGRLVPEVVADLLQRQPLCQQVSGTGMPQGVGAIVGQGHVQGVKPPAERPAPG